MGVSDSSEADDDSDGYAMAGNGFGLRTTETSDAQATGRAHESCTYDTVTYGYFYAEWLCRSTASAAANATGSCTGASS